MIRLICFAAASFEGGSKEFVGNDPNLTITGDDFTLASAVVVDGSWTLYDDVNFAGNAIVLNRNSGPDADGVYRDHADWGGAAIFHVKSIQRS